MPHPGVLRDYSSGDPRWRRGLPRSVTCNVSAFPAPKYFVCEFFDFPERLSGGQLGQQFMWAWRLAVALSVLVPQSILVYCRRIQGPWTMLRGLSVWLGGWKQVWTHFRPEYIDLCFFLLDLETSLNYPLGSPASDGGISPNSVQGGRCFPTQMGKHLAFRPKLIVLAFVESRTEVFSIFYCGAMI